MAERRPPYAPEYRRQMVCASPWCGQVARPGSWLGSSSVQSVQGTQYTSLAFDKHCRETGGASFDRFGRGLLRQRDDRELLRRARMRVHRPAFFPHSGAGEKGGVRYRLPTPVHQETSTLSALAHPTHQAKAITGPRDRGKSTPGGSSSPARLRSVEHRRHLRREAFEQHRDGGLPRSRGRFPGAVTSPLAGTGAGRNFDRHFELPHTAGEGGHRARAPIPPKSHRCLHGNQGTGGWPSFRVDMGQRRSRPGRYGASAMARLAHRKAQG